MWMKHVLDSNSIFGLNSFSCSVVLSICELSCENSSSSCTLVPKYSMNWGLTF